MVVATPAALELGVGAVTSAVVAVALVWTNPTGWWAEAACLMLLTLAAGAAEARHAAVLGSLFEARAAASSGLAVGALSLPWVLAALAGKHFSAGLDPGLAVLALRCSLAAAALSTTHVIQPGKAGGRASTGRGTRNRTPEPAAMVGPGKAFDSFVLAALGAVLVGAMAAGWVGSASLAQPCAVAAFAVGAAWWYHAVMAALPGTFTLGEGLVVSQAVLLLACVVGLMSWPSTGVAPPSLWTQFSAFVACLIVAALGVAAALVYCLRTAHTAAAAPCPPTHRSQRLYERRKALLAAAAVALGGAGAAVRPALWCLSFVFGSPARLAVVGQWVVLLAGALPAMHLLARSQVLPNILVRKGYHLLAMALFVPALLREPQLLGLALAVAFAALAAVEVVRLGQLPGISAKVHSFMSSFVDSRDSGLVFFSHFALLLGMAGPIWLGNALDQGAPSAVASRLWPAVMAGIMALGVGDTAASVVGRGWGRTPVAVGSSKTVEGTVGGGVAVLAAWAVLLQWAPGMQAQVGWPGLVAATALSSVLEAATAQLDNLVVPLHYLALLLCMV